MKRGDVATSNRKIKIGFEGIAYSLDESVANVKYAKSCYNFAFDKGVLTGRIGIDEAQGYYPYPDTARHAYPSFSASMGVKKLFLYRRTTQEGAHDDRLIAQRSDGTFWYTAVFYQDNWHQLAGLLIEGDADAVNYNYNGEDVLILLARGSYTYMINDNVVTYFSKAPHFSSLAVHNERVFGSVSGNKTQLWFSDDFNPGNWNVSETEAGYINFADEYGEIVKVVSFSNYLYVFREYAIFRLTAYGDQNDFLLKKVFSDTSRIYKDTIVLAGDKIMFCAENGVFAFDGYDLTRVGKEIPEVKNKNAMRAGYLDDVYYIACNVEELGGEDNNALVFYDMKNGSVSILSDVSVICLCPVKVHNGSDMLCALSGANKNRVGMMSKSGCVMGAITKKIYKSPIGVVQSPYMKTVRYVSVLSKYPIKIRAVLDGKICEKEVAGSEMMQNVIIEKCGSVVSFEIESDVQNVYVVPMYASVDLMRG